VPPYVDWSTAARNIQDAIDVALPYEEISVTNGIYSTGGRPVYGSLTNRVTLDKPVTVKSVNGPLFTRIQGHQEPGMLFGDNAVRCAYLTNGASLSGFTLTNGATRSAGDQILEGSGGGVWCEPNAALSNCVVTGNVVPWYGGGVFGGTLYNCLLVGNSATNNGAGACSNRLYNCTVGRNYSLYGCGGVTGSILRNCIVYFNSGSSLGMNFLSSYLDYCCTTPQAGGNANITADPLFIDTFGGNLHLQSNSPCINIGHNADAPFGPDLDGNPRIARGTVDLGAYEYQGLVIPVAPYITMEPTDVLVTPGSNATFSVTAGGSLPLFYEWSTNHSVVPDATNFSITLTNVQLSQSGTVVSVKVLNQAGSTTSRDAVLTVDSSPPPAIAGTHYVDANSATPQFPYTNWGTAAATIQDAVDAAVQGDEVVVTNGIYATGGRDVFGNNRVAVTKPLTLLSVNGPLSTAIVGYQLPGTITGNGAVRCAFLTNGTSLIGFTLTNGASLSFGGSYDEHWNGGGLLCYGTNTMVSNCVITACAAGGLGGGADGGNFYNCSFNSNSVQGDGGGGAECVLFNCTLSGNSAGGSGGGVELATLSNSVLTGNSASYAGGAYLSTLNNCTVTGNSAAAGGGGIAYSTADNCILYYNANGNYANSVAYGSQNYCCTTPMPAGGGNITDEPLFVDRAAGNLRLQSNSPCINAGNNAFVSSSTDLDGNPRAAGGTVDMGAYEFQGPFPPVPPFITLQPTNQTVLMGSNVGFVVGAGGTGLLTYQWSFQGVSLAGATNSFLTLTNVQVAQSGNYAVTITNSSGAVTSSNALLTVIPAPVPGTHYVAVNSLNPIYPFTNWATAAVTIQDAVDGAVAGDEIVVSNGVYSTGGRAVLGMLTNRVTVEKTLLLRSVNGPQVTIIQGDQVPGSTNGDAAIRCVYLGANGASLSGFTLTNGATRTTGNFSTEQCGGGLYIGYGSTAVASNCVIVGCSAAGVGAGAYFANLYNCALLGNTGGYGAGAYESALYNCSVVANNGGGVYDGTAYNSIIALNPWGNADFTQGNSNFGADPFFVDVAAGDLRLLSNSPCVNAGNNAYAPAGPDLGGGLRIVGGTVDIGAYEFQGFSAPVAPYLLSQPANQTVVAGLKATFSVVAGGSTPLSYQWQFQGTDIPGATNATLTVNPVQSSQAGSYSVIVTNVAGFVESSQALLTVNLPPAHYVDQNSPNPAAPFSTWSTAARTIQDAVNVAAPGDQVLVTNGWYDAGGAAVRGADLIAVRGPIVVSSVNGPQSTFISGSGLMRCVNLTSGASLSGFTLTNGAADSGGGVSSVDNSAFVSNCTLIGNTAQYGGGAADGGTFFNCTLTGNSATDGGGAASSTLVNCIITGNWATDSGGGVSYCTLTNCLLTANSATNFGGGAYAGSCFNCTVVGNSANYGGGGYGFDSFMIHANCLMYNSIIYYNTALMATNCLACTQFDVCTPAEEGGTAPGNVSGEPLFVDLPGGNLRLQAGSPCINAGDNSFIYTSADLDGNPRIVGGTVDIGAYEFQGPSGMTFQAWLASYGLPTDGSADYADTDGDGMNNWQEWVCGTDPTNPLSVLRMLSPSVTGSNVTVTWQSVSGVSYFLERCLNLGSSNVFSLVATNIPGQAGTNFPGQGGLTTFVDTNASGGAQLLYRVGIRH
jgi:hypothetical protein